jgi:site-specific recombinase XerD
MDEVIDIHGSLERLRRAERMVEENPLSASNVRLIRQFEQKLKSEGLSPRRMEKYLDTLRLIGERLGDFEKATEEDIRRYVSWLESQPYSAWTKQSYKVILKRFYRWLRGNDEEYPSEVRWIKTTLKEKDKPLPRELPTEEEIRKLVEAADNPRDRAFIMTLYETGGRIGEVGSLRIKDVEFLKDYAAVHLRGKTGSRRVPVVAAVPYLSLWLEHHPDRTNRDAPLWPKFSDGKPMTYPALAKVLKVAAERSGLKKRVSPHKLRHARATFLATKLTEAQMNVLFGWKQGSDMPSTYVHLSGRDLDDALLGIYGLRKKEEGKPAKLAPRDCPRCRQKNPATSRFCSKCGMALDMEAVMELERRRGEADELMNLVIKDPEVQEAIKRALAKYLNSGASPDS